MAEMLHMKTRVVDIETVHAYGCSMPAGHEITHPATLDKKHRIVQLLEGPELHRVIRADKKECWVATVCNNLGVDHINNARYGLSNEHSAWILLEDIMKGRIQRNHAVFFCITLLTRVMYFDPLDGKPLSKQLHSWAEDTPEILEHYNDYKMLYNYFLLMQQIMLMCKSVGAPLYFIPSFEHPTWNLMADYRPYNPDVLKVQKKIKDDWQFRKIIDLIAREMNGMSLLVPGKIQNSSFLWYAESLNPNVDHKDFHALTKKGIKLREKTHSPGRHPNKYSHDKYAEELTKLLKPEKAK